MTGVRRRGYFAAAVAVLGAALVAALFAAPPERPVDIRLVAPPPPAPETITATATTTVSAVAPVAVTTVPPPPPPPARPLPRQSAAPTSAPSSSKPHDFFDFLRCDYKYFDDDFERCLPWPLTPKELCEYVEDHHLDLDLIEVRGRDGHEHDLDFDCD
ncbi:hypothetical protein [Lentzea sp. NPDC051838]|uniref:hypothetical protein n=1 Tax=Lentzea sp. NPDC051838 TaxID=3154849 RepID=UPI003418C678